MRRGPARRRAAPTWSPEPQGFVIAFALYERRRSGRCGEPGVRQVEPGPERGHRRRDVEAGLVIVSTSVPDVPSRARSSTAMWLSRFRTTKRAAVEKQAVAVAERGPAEIDQLRHAGLRVYPVELAEGGVDHQKRVAVRRLGDAVRRRSPALHPVARAAGHQVGLVGQPARRGRAGARRAVRSASR